MAFVATASATQTPPRSPASRPNLVSVGTIVWLSSELMFFAALFAMYFTIRSVDKSQGLPWPGAHLNLTLGTINTTVLLIIGRADDGWLAAWSGADAVISHPIDPRALASALAGLMRQRGAVAQA